MKNKKNKVVSTRVFDVEPFKVELFESEDLSYGKAVVTLSNNSIRYEFNPSSEMYWYISFMGHDAEALKTILTMLSLTMDYLCVDPQFLRDIFRAVSDAVERKMKEGAAAADSVTKEDEEAAQEFMEGVAKKIEERKNKE